MHENNNMYWASIWHSLQQKDDHVPWAWKSFASMENFQECGKVPQV